MEPQASTAPSPSPYQHQQHHHGHGIKPQRVLACLLCQQRKVKCNKSFPCQNCIKAGAQCVPATLHPRQRRRRFPERELLDRLRHYESLLRQHNIPFEPMHGPALDASSAHGDDEDHASPDERPSTARTPAKAHSTDEPIKSERGYQAKNFWHVMHQKRSEENDDNSDSAEDIPAIQHATKQMSTEIWQNNDQLLFGSGDPNVDVSTLHPEQVHIFRLWQLFIDNVNPLLKVIHTPSMQSRIIDAASNLVEVSPISAALMFSIYCVSILSLTDNECVSMFSSPKEKLLLKYQYACRQAILKCGFLRTMDRDCLTAVFLYLVSVKPATGPPSLCAMFGVVIRLAQRIGIHSEYANAQRPPFEAEMRRRLWWALVFFDARVSELAMAPTSMLNPTWDCRVPANVNDFDLQPDMKDPPPAQEKPTEAIFIVVRCVIGDFVRHSKSYLDFLNPVLNALAREVRHSDGSETGQLGALDKAVEEKYLKFCNPDNKLHYMTIWIARGYLARRTFFDHVNRSHDAPSQPTEFHRDTIVSLAIDMLECDTKVVKSPLTKGYYWLPHWYFPMPAYIHLVQEIRRRPLAGHVDRGWEAMSENYEHRFEAFAVMLRNRNPFFKVFSKAILGGWKSCEAAFTKAGKPIVVPSIVTQINQEISPSTFPTPESNSNPDADFLDINFDFSMPMQVDSGTQVFPFGMPIPGYGDSLSGTYQASSDAPNMSLHPLAMTWPSVTWNTPQGNTWG